jgi:DUF971 family protein
LTGSGPDLASRPTRIIREVDSRTLRIPWADGHESVYGWEYLRRNCPCAHCRGEWSVKGMIDENTILLANQTVLTTLEHVGHYAVRITWGDGHATGIYAFRELRGICPCSACSR